MSNIEDRIEQLEKEVKKLKKELKKEIQDRRFHQQNHLEPEMSEKEHRTFFP